MVKTKVICLGTMALMAVACGRQQEESEEPNLAGAHDALVKEGKAYSYECKITHTRQFESKQKGRVEPEHSAPAKYSTITTANLVVSAIKEKSEVSFNGYVVTLAYVDDKIETKIFSLNPNDKKDRKELYVDPQPLTRKNTEAPRERGEQKFVTPEHGEFVLKCEEKDGAKPKEKKEG